MTVSIAQRFRPFSHLPGTTCLLPRTSLVVQGFPALLRVRGLFELPLEVKGPVREFTLQQDLERGIVSIWGVAQKERFRISLCATESAVELTGAIRRHFPYSGPFVEPSFPLERLSLGSHRAQDWDQMMRRFDQRELLPILFQMSHWIPLIENRVRTGMFRLLDQDFSSFLLAAFSGMFTPCLIDEKHHGVLPVEELPEGVEPISLIQEARKKIRGLFFRQEGAHLHLLPASPFEVGRMVDVCAKGLGTLNFEWRKGLLLRLVFHAAHDAELFLDTRATSFRVRTSRQEKGFRVEKNKALPVKAGVTYFVDRFQ
jgi:hypothetical protein